MDKMTEDLKTGVNWKPSDVYLYGTPEAKKKSMEAAKSDFIENYRKRKTETETVGDFIKNENRKIKSEQHP